MDYKFIKTEEHPHRLDIIIDNPPVNILTGEVMKEMIHLLRATCNNKDYRVVVLKGAGKAWSAGADVSEHLPGKFQDMLKVFGELCEFLREYQIPTVAAVNGLCLGGGCEVAAMCDFIVASEKAKFGQPEIKVGVFPPAAGAHFARKYGINAALEIILTGDVFNAETAKHMGLVTQVVPVETFDEEVDKFVGRITCNSRVVLRHAKRAVLRALELKPKDAAKKVDEIYADQLMSSQDAAEGLNAFLEKRQPEWKDE
ncbi:enoyl-CoA hydratase/isomerase family protein [bacterium]|nr:enoyl-CoA hydratase/isomerase family protein [bacterium]